MNLNEANSGDIIKINAGGRRFTTLRSTITQVEGSLLGTMFSGRWDEQATSSDGFVFLDLDPDCFAEILVQLREQALTGRPVNWCRVSGPAGREKHFVSVLRYLKLIDSNPRQLSFIVYEGLRHLRSITGKKRIASSLDLLRAIGTDFLSPGDSWGLKILLLPNSLNTPMFIGIYHKSNINCWVQKEKKILCPLVNPQGISYNQSPGFEEGDELTIKLCESVLKMKVQRIPNKTFTITIPSYCKWRFIVHILTESSVELVRPFECL